MSQFTLTSAEIKHNIDSLQEYMKLNDIQRFYISSYDPYLNEYVPMRDCHRYYVTGFSGSVAEALVFQEGRVKLYVDGRYHEQADLECDIDMIDIVKVPQNVGVIQMLKKDLEVSTSTVAIEADRTSLDFYEYLNEKNTVKSLLKQELNAVINFEKKPKLPPIHSISKELLRVSPKDKLNKILKNETDAYFVSAIDSLAWLTNCRGYHLPHLSSFLGRGFVVFDKIYVFIDTGVEFDCTDPFVEFINCDSYEIESYLKNILDNYKIDQLFIDKKMMNTLDYIMLKSIFSDDKLIHIDGGLVEFHSIKNEDEIRAIKNSFEKADKAIYQTILWVKEQLKVGREISEWDLSQETRKKYHDEGAKELSFGTIAGVGPNASLIHYGQPKKEIKISKADMILLDSGGYFETGFATDTTRTFMAANEEGSKKHKQIYTLVLKGALAVQNAVFKEGTCGHGLDAICRQPLFQAGFDYAHGTGHGVGIHVHEGGVGISPRSAKPFKVGQVVSVEPGIYIPGFGGVRIENICLVAPHPTFKDFLIFENLVYIGYEPLLIDESLLNEQEKSWLKSYEKECLRRGRSFRANSF